jgi:hypothetical protein
MQCKELSQQHYLDCIGLLNTVPPKVAAKYPKPTPLALTNYYFDDAEALYKVFGAYDEFNVLNACVFTQFSDYDRSWRLVYVAKQSFAPFSAVLDTLETLFTYAEQRNFCRWYTIYFFRHDLSWERILRRKLPMFNRYSIATEDVIAANQRSSFSKYWIEVQQRTIYLDPIILKQYSLLEEYRVT